MLPSAPGKERWNEHTRQEIAFMPISLGFKPDLASGGWCRRCYRNGSVCAVGFLDLRVRLEDAVEGVGHATMIQLHARRAQSFLALATHWNCNV